MFHFCRRFTLGVMLCITVLAGCQSSEQKFAAHMQRATKYTEDKKHTEAYIELKNALKLNPNDATVNHALAKNLQATGRLADAVFYYQEAYRLNPENTEAALAVAGLLLGTDLPQAEKIVEEIIAANPKNALAYVRKSEIALVHSDVAEALRWANTAIEVAPLDPENYTNLGRVYRAQIRKSQILQEPLEPAVLQAGEAAFQRALELDPNLWGAKFELARVYSVWPNHEKEAEEAFRSAFSAAIERNERLGAQQVSLEALAYAIRIKNENFERWILEKTIETMPGNLMLWVHYANFEAQHGGSGEKVFQRLLDQQPDNVTAHVLYARYLQDNKQLDEAIRHLEQTAASSKNPEIALGALVDLHIRHEQIEEARRILEKMLKKYPGHARTRLAHAQVLVLEHKYVEARDLLRDASVELDDAAAWRLLALVEYNLNALPEALKAIEKAAELTKPPTASMLRLKSQILHATKDWLGTIGTLRELAGMQGLEPADRLRLAQALFGMNKIENGKQILEGLLKEEVVLVTAVLEFVDRFGKEDPAQTRSLVEKAYASYPNNPRLLYHLTQLDIAEGKKGIALERLRKATKNSSAVDPAIYVMLGHLLVAEKSFDEARTYAVKAFQINPNASGVTKLFLEVHFLLGQGKQAIPLFEAAEKAGKLSVPNQHLLTQLWIGNQEPKKAEALLETILEENPNYAPAKNDLAYLLAERGADLERALKLAESARQELANDANSADTLGFVYLRKGLYPAAAQQFRTAIDLVAKDQKKNPIYYLHLGQALQGDGDYRGAVKAFENALEIGKDFPEAQTVRRELEAARAKLSSAG